MNHHYAVSFILLSQTKRKTTKRWIRCVLVHDLFTTESLVRLLRVACLTARSRYVFPSRCYFVCMGIVRFSQPTWEFESRCGRWQRSNVSIRFGNGWVSGVIATSVDGGSKVQCGWWPHVLFFAIQSNVGNKSCVLLFVYKLKGYDEHFVFILYQLYFQHKQNENAWRKDSDGFPLVFRV